MAVTKVTKPSKNEEYQQWEASEFSAGDILDIEGSMGHGAKSVTIESDGGPSVVQFNVVKRIVKSHRAVGNDLYGAASEFFPSPVVIEIEETRPNFSIVSGDVQNFSAFVVTDIKIITKAPNMRISTF